MKTCVTCSIVKEETEYYFLPHTKDNLSSSCKSCVKVRAALWNKTNKERRKEITLLSASNCREQRNKQAKVYREINKEKLNLYTKNKKSSNRPLYTAYENKRRATKLNATPLWANLNYIKLFYILAKEEEIKMGTKIHVDHIVPLKSKFVCGLHNEFNLQLLTQKENASKHNSWWPGMEVRNLK